MAKLCDLCTSVFYVIEECIRPIVSSLVIISSIMKNFITAYTGIRFLNNLYLIFFNLRSAYTFSNFVDFLLVLQKSHRMSLDGNTQSVYPGNGIESHHSTQLSSSVVNGSALTSSSLTDSSASSTNKSTSFFIAVVESGKVEPIHSERCEYVKLEDQQTSCCRVM